MQSHISSSFPHDHIKRMLFSKAGFTHNSTPITLTMRIYYHMSTTPNTMLPVAVIVMINYRPQYALPIQTCWHDMPSLAVSLSLVQYSLVGLDGSIITERHLCRQCYQLQHFPTHIDFCDTTFQEAEETGVLHQCHLAHRTAIEFSEQSKNKQRGSSAQAHKETPEHVDKSSPAQEISAQREHEASEDVDEVDLVGEDSDGMVPLLLRMGMLWHSAPAMMKRIKVVCGRTSMHKIHRPSMCAAHISKLRIGFLFPHRQQIM